MTVYVLTDDRGKIIGIYEDRQDANTRKKELERNQIRTTFYYELNKYEVIPSMKGDIKNV